MKHESETVGRKNFLKHEKLEKTVTNFGKITRKDEYKKFYVFGRYILHQKKLFRRQRHF